MEKPEWFEAVDAVESAPESTNTSSLGAHTSRLAKRFALVGVAAVIAGGGIAFAASNKASPTQAESSLNKTSASPETTLPAAPASTAASASTAAPASTASESSTVAPSAPVSTIATSFTGTAGSSQPSIGIAGGRPSISGGLAGGDDGNESGDGNEGNDD
jgi:hypothetical protein